MISANPYDVLSAIFCFYPKDRFKNDREKIHSSLYKIRSQQNFFELLKDFIFRKNLNFPRSRVLDEVLSSLQPEFLGKINPAYDVYTIKKDSLHKLWESDLKTSLESKEPEIKEIAEELHKLLGDA